MEPAAPVDPTLLDALRRLMEALAMDFAADFKTSPATGRLIFPEINSSPIFAAFDRAAGGAVAESILDRLTEVDE